MKKAGIYPGTFDPLTHGHLDVIRRASLLLDRLVVAVASNPRKNTLFSHAERLQMLQTELKGIRGVEVTGFDGLLVDFAHKKGIRILVRGLRAFSDFEYEFMMALSNRKLAPDLETVFLMTSETCSYVSSSVVKEVALLGGDISKFVPANVKKAMSVKMAEMRTIQGEDKRRKME